MKYYKYEVFILTYNRKEYLKYAINSILTQSFKPHRLTIIDNGSIDGTSDICQEYQNNGVIYIRNTANNQFGVWEQIKKIVDSDYLMIFHDDDLLHFDYLKNVNEIIQCKNNVVMIGCATSVSNINNISSFIFPSEKIKYQEFNTYTLANLLFRGFPLPFCSIVYKSEYFKNIDFKFDSYGKFFDRPLILEFSKLGNVVIIKNKLVRTFLHYHQDSKTISKGGNEEKLISVIKVYKNILGTSLLRKGSYVFFIFNYKWLLYFYKWNGKESSRFKFFQKSIEYSATTSFALTIGLIYYYLFDLKSKVKCIKNLFSF
jgi:glycosyltransferase involved in cell wall biosynthesis